MGQTVAHWGLEAQRFLKHFSGIATLIKFSIWLLKDMILVSNPIQGGQGGLRGDKQGLWSLMWSRVRSGKSIQSS